ncbi:MAG: RICIN domain-containing protein, partial [Rivularia sp. ALOHA_DT_140]|nr:RICIN domain-containing protein [Rivularia sp. ALOHA_DT_140]
MTSNLQRKFTLKLTAKVLFSLLISSFGLGLYFIFDGQASDAESKTGTFIINKLSGKCIDVAGAPGQDNAAKLQLFDCEFDGRNRDNNSETDQRWTVTGDGFIKNSLSGKCIDVAGAPGQTNAAKLQLFDCELDGRNQDNNSKTDQRWSITGDGFIKNNLSGK